MRKPSLCMMLLVIVAGCHQDPFAPGAPPFLDSTRTELIKKYNDWPKVIDEYEHADAASRQTKRDRIVEDLLTLVDTKYYDFRRSLYTGRAVTDLGFDLTNLGLSFAATISGGEQTKTILSALIAGVTGTKLAVNENLFTNKTSLAIITKMDAMRTAQRLKIETQLDRNAQEYPLHSALKDVADYYDAGTVITALTAITETASQEKAVAQKELTDYRTEKYLPDDASATLRRYYKPDGKIINAENAQRLKTWMGQNEVDVSVTTFLNGASYADKRAKAVKDLKLQSGGTINPTTQPG